MAIKKLDHIGIIVNDLNQAIQQYEYVLGLKLNRIEDYGEGLLKIAFFSLGDVLIELIQPLKEGSSAWDFLHHHGEGVEHIAFEVENIDSELTTLIEKKVPLHNKIPKPGAGGADIAFLKRTALNGVLGEFVSHQKIR